MMTLILVMNKYVTPWRRQYFFFLQITIYVSMNPGQVSYTDLTCIQSATCFLSLQLMTQVLLSDVCVLNLKGVKAIINL